MIITDNRVDYYLYTELEQRLNLAEENHSHTSLLLYNLYHLIDDYEDRHTCLALTGLKDWIRENKDKVQNYKEKIKQKALSKLTMYEKDILGLV